MKARLFSLLILLMVFSAILQAQKTIEGVSKSYRFTIGAQEVNLPPILRIDTISFSHAYLRAGESAELMVTLMNTGFGDAKDVFVNLSGGVPGLSFPSTTPVNTISKDGGQQTVTIPFSSTIDLPNAEATVRIEVVEPNFKVTIKAKQLTFQTLEFLKPELILAQNAVIENQSSNPNRQIDINETIDLKLAVQNIGQGTAERVSVHVTNNQTGVLFLGVGDDLRSATKTQPFFSSLDAGSFETVTYHYFVTSDFPDSELVFTIAANEKNNRFGFTEQKTYPINKVLYEEGFIRTVASRPSEIKGQPVIVDVPEFMVDVDYDIPSAGSRQDNAFAVIIANENYQRADKVPFALNDGRVFKEYCTKTLGIPAANIRLLENATFGIMRSEIRWLKNITEAKKGEARVFLYYAGHGIPDPSNRTAFLLPTDGTPSDFESAIGLSALYNDLTEHPSEGVFVFLDACFSGNKRDGGMIDNARKAAIIPNTIVPNGKLLVISAASSDEPAYSLDEKQHGLFTYYLLKKIRETSGDISIGELSDFVIQQVKVESLRKKSNRQTPQVIPGREVIETWKDLKLK